MKNDKYKQELIIMCALPGAGKSTYVKNNFPFAKVESRDEVRFSLVKPDEEYFSKENEVFRTWTDSIKADIMNGLPTIVADATHLNETSRRKLINALKGFLKDVKISVVVIDNDIETCLAQNELRAGTRSYVPPTAIRNMAKSFHLPTLDKEEYIDEIVIYKNRNCKVLERS